MSQALKWPWRKDRTAMRRGVLAAMMIAAVMAAGMPAEAQVKLRFIPKQIYLQKPSKGPRPMVRPQPGAVKPMIPLYRATQMIQQAIHGAKVLKIRPLPGGDIVATIR